MSRFVRKYGKTIVAGGAAGVYALQAAISDGQVTSPERVGILTAVVAAVAVYFAPAVTKESSKVEHV